MHRCLDFLSTKKHAAIATALGALFSIAMTAHATTAARLTPQAIAQLQAKASIDKVAIVDAAYVGNAGKRMVAVGERGLIFISDNQGKSWTVTPSGSEKALTGATSLTDDVLVLTGHSGTILRSTDAGAHWSQASSTQAQREALLGVLSMPDGRALAYGSYASFMESADGGQTWTPRQILDADIDKHVYGLARIGQAMVLVGEAGLIAVSDDTGKNWKTVESPYRGSLFGVAAMPGDRFVAFGMRGKILLSSDMGHTWKELDSQTDSPLFTATLLKDGQLLLTGKDGVLSMVSGAGAVDTRHTKDRRTVARALQADDKSLLLFGEAGVRRVQWNELGK